MLKNGASAHLPYDEDAAVELGVKALQFIAADPVQLHRFLALSGLSIGQLREASREPQFFAGLLDFILGHEDTLLGFAAQAQIQPQAVNVAREALAPAFGAVPR